MSRTKMRGCAAAVVLALLGTPALAADNMKSFPASAQAAPGGRDLEVIVAQAELGSNINVSFASVALGGGLLPALIDAKVDSDRSKRAKAGITPLRNALSDFDADELAINTTRAAVEKVSWFQPGALNFSRDPIPADKAAALTKTGASQVAYFEYVYDMPPDFSSVRVGVKVTIASKGPPGDEKPQSRLSSRNLLCSLVLTSVVYLPKAGAGPDNAQRWAADNGTLARQALNVGFTRVGALIPRALALTSDDLAKMKALEVKKVGAISGGVVEEGPEGTLMFNGGLVHVQATAE